jgi:hypothetical protein
MAMVPVKAGFHRAMGFRFSFSNSYVVRPDDLISGPSWFETRGAAALLTTRIW